MIIVLHGKDDYRIDQKLKEIINGYQKKNKSGVNLIYISEKPSFNDLKDESRQVGMFEEKRLLVGKGILKDKKLRKKIEKKIDLLADNENILILKENQKLKSKFVKKIEKLDKEKGIIKEYKKLKGKNLKNWYKKEFSKQKAEINGRALNKLVKYVGNDLWRANNEICKLSNMIPDRTITEKDITNYVKPEVETNIFEAIDALANGNKKKAVNLFEKQLADGDSPFYLLSMINYQIRNLLIIKDLEDRGFSYKQIMKKSKMKSFVFKKAYSQSKRLSFEQVKKIHQTLFEVDLNSKLGKVKAESGLMLIISQF